MIHLLVETIDLRMYLAFSRLDTVRLFVMAYILERGTTSARVVSAL
jgi:hypothetical protein